MTTKQRESTGGGYESRGKFYARVTVAPQKREGVLLPWCSSLDDAVTRGQEIQPLVNRLRAGGHFGWIEKILEAAGPGDAEKMAGLARVVDGIVGGDIVEDAVPLRPGGMPTTFEAFAMRWVKGELAVEYPDHVERKRSAGTDHGWLKKYVFPVIGPKPIATLTLEDYEQVMREVAQRAKPRKLAPRSRHQIAQVMRRVLQLAEYPAKLVTRNPIPANALPKVKTETGLQFCYPDEDAILMADTRADLGHRVLFGFLHRQGLRRADALGGKVDEIEDAIEDEEALGDVPPLTWARVDLRRGYILPDRNKTGDTSLTNLEPDIVRALRAWKAASSPKNETSPVFVDSAGTLIEADYVINAYRAMLRAALVAKDLDRPELWTAGPGRLALRLHDTRASMVTVAFANGRSEDWIRRRTKHTSSALERYRRGAGTFREMNLGDWVPLDLAIPELAAVLAAADRGSDATDGDPSSGSPPQEDREIATIDHLQGTREQFVDPAVAGSSPVGHPKVITEESAALSPPPSPSAAAFAAVNAAAKRAIIEDEIQRARYDKHWDDVIELRLKLAKLDVPTNVVKFTRRK